ncbi:transglycosylase SLT domain-containing protein, partial [Methylopila musalis]
MKAGLFGIALAVVFTHGAAAQTASGPAQYDAIIARHAAVNGVPETLVRRVIVRESRYNPKAYNRGHYGMMQIKHATAKGMGYRGDAAGLLDADTNLTYAVRYLAGAYRTARGNPDRAVQLYASGYYYEAKRQGLLDQVGMGRRGASVFAQAMEMAPHGRAKAPATVVASAEKPAVVTTATATAKPAVVTATAEPRQPRVIAVNVAPALASAAPLPPV